MVIAMKGVHFNATTIEALMESLYELNKKLLMREGKLMPRKSWYRGRRLFTKLYDR